MVNEKDRHRTGSFYTPTKITDYNASMSIGAKVHELMRGRLSKPTTSFDLALDSAPIKELRAFYLEDLCSITVLDPSCGEGAFLLSCLDFLVSIRTKCLRALHRRRCREKRIQDQYLDLTNDRLGPRVLGESIFGVDIDHRALEKCRRALIGSFWKKRPTKSMEGTLKRNLRLGNALIGFVKQPSQTLMTDFIGRSPKKEDLDTVYRSFLSKNLGRKDPPSLEDKHMFHWYKEFPDNLSAGGFDVVIGNPPYGDRALSSSERMAIKAMYPHGTVLTDDKGKGSINPSSVFIERSEPLLAPGGQLAYIVPSSLARVREFEKLRMFLHEKFKPWHMVDEGSPFKGITLEMFSIFARKGQAEDRAIVDMCSHRPGTDDRSWAVPLSVLRKYRRFMLYWDGTFDRVVKGCQTGLISGRRGPTIPKHRYNKRSDGSYPVPLLISGKAIQRYRFVPEEFHWTRKSALTTQEHRSIFEAKMIVGTRLTDKYRVCIKSPGLMVADNVIRIDHERRRITPEALCLVLNSKLMQYVVKRYLFNNNQLTLFIQSVVEATPIRLPEHMDVFTRIGTMMLSLGKGWPETGSLLDEMDRFVVDPLVYELFLFDEGLGLAEILSSELGPSPNGAVDLLNAVKDDSTYGRILDRIYVDPDVTKIEDGCLWP